MVTVIITHYNLTCTPQRQCRGERSLQACGWTISLLLSCPPTLSHQPPVRRQRDGTRISVPCPEAVLSYNTNMGGVDRGDQLRGYYSCRTKSQKFYRYILYNVSITNAVEELRLCNWDDIPSRSSVCDLQSS